MIAMRNLRAISWLALVPLVVVGCAAVKAQAPDSSRQLAPIALSPIQLKIPDAEVVAAWALPNDMFLSKYGAVRLGDQVAFGTDVDAAGSQPGAAARGNFGVISLRTGRLQLLPALLLGAWTNLITGTDGYWIRTETRPSTQACGRTDGACTEWLIAATPATGGPTFVLDGGVTSAEAVNIPRVVTSSLGVAWQRPVAGGQSEVVWWRAGFDRPLVVGGASGQGQLAGTVSGWLLATMWGRGPTLLDVGKGVSVASPALNALVAGPSLLAYAVPAETDALPGTSDIDVGQVVGGKLVGKLIAQVSDVYGLGWADSLNLLVATPNGTSLVPINGAPIISLPAVGEFTSHANGTGAVIAVAGERGEMGIAVVKPAGAAR